MTPLDKISPKNQSAIKAIDIIEFLALCENRPQRLCDIASALSMSTSTVLRFLIALTECGYIHQDTETQRYSLTMKICNIANKVSENLDLYDMALPFMRKLSNECNESVCLAIEQNMTVVYIGVVWGPDQMVRTMQRIGNRAPMHCTGVGKVLLLNYSNSDIDELIKTKQLTKFTNNTITTKVELLQELDSVRNSDIAYDNEECEIGARCIAVPIRNYTGKIIAGMSVTGPIFRMDDNILSTMSIFLINAGAELSKLLGWN